MAVYLLAFSTSVFIYYIFVASLPFNIFTFISLLFLRSLLTVLKYTIPLVTNKTRYVKLVGITAHNCYER
jgi:hypothetical protein